LAAGILAERERQRLRREGRLSASSGGARISLWGQAWRIAFVLGAASIASADVAFVAA